MPALFSTNIREGYLSIEALMDAIANDETPFASSSAIDGAAFDFAVDYLGVPTLKVNFLGNFYLDFLAPGITKLWVRQILRYSPTIFTDGLPGDDESYGMSMDCYNNNVGYTHGFGFRHINRGGDLKVGQWSSQEPYTGYGESEEVAAESLVTMRDGSWVEQIIYYSWNSNTLTGKYWRNRVLVKDDFSLDFLVTPLDPIGLVEAGMFNTGSVSSDDYINVALIEAYNGVTDPDPYDLLVSEDSGSGRGTRIPKRLLHSRRF